MLWRVYLSSLSNLNLQLKLQDHLYQHQRLQHQHQGVSEVLCYYYGNLEEENQKINLIKSRETSNKEDEMLKSLNDRLELYLKENIKSDSYFKIKSGLFGGTFDLRIK